MHDWPTDPSETPSPQLAAAWLTLDTLPTELIPLWAAHWIAAGYDGQALAELAGLHGDDPHEIRDLIPAALAECGVCTPADPSEDHERAAAMVAFTAIAQLQADGLASERWVVDKVVQITQPYFKRSITGLPLGQLFALDDEWGAGWAAPTNNCAQPSSKPVRGNSKQPVPNLPRIFASSVAMARRWDFATSAKLGRLSAYRP